METSSDKPTIKPTAFRLAFDHGELPVDNEALRRGKITWQNDENREDLNYKKWLPVFFEGLSEEQEPYGELAMRGVLVLLTNGGDRVRPTLPQLITPLKNAMDSNIALVMSRALLCLQSLLQCDTLVGLELVKYYRIIMPACARFKNQTISCRDPLDSFHPFGDADLGMLQYEDEDTLADLDDVIDETLRLMEIHGGKDAFRNIKYMIPTYESCMDE